MSVQSHERSASGIVARCAIITLSDTRTLADDAGGDRIADLLTAAGHVVAERTLLRDEPRELAGVLDRWLYRHDLHCTITTGGTGISARDRTVAVVRERIALELPGFGETFRRLSFDAIGPAAILSRALGGISGPPNPSALFALPGSVHAVELATSRLIVPLLPHLLSELRKGGNAAPANA